MKILQIMAGKGNGGAELYSKDVMIGLHEQGVDQVVVVREEAPATAELRAQGLRVVSSPLDAVLRSVQRFRLGRLIEKEQPDIVQCWMRRAASLIPPHTRRKRAVIGWFGDYEELPHFSSCNRFVGVTQDLCDHMVAAGINPQDTKYIPTFSSVDNAPPLARASLNTPETAPVVITLSRLHPTKGIDTLIQALVKLDDVYLWIAGDGPLRDDLELLAEKLGVAPRVRFLGWRTDRGSLLRAADICVLPSRYEPFGTVIIDAWIAGIPLVACDSAGPKAHVRTRENGMLVPKDNPDALGEAIRELLGNDGLRNAIIENAYMEYSASFSRSFVIDSYKRYYESIIQDLNFQKYRRSWLKAHVSS
ncbi:glycosyltransferase [Acidiphilium sp. PM]|uniref:glycosyltransferase n=1 Tax=Acidiphilium sp. PM TaxID=1043206 RepID=UPI000681658D|nr:glycosyltransferase [Acidiphilium sp. PM]